MDGLPAPGNIDDQVVRFRMASVRVAAVLGVIVALGTVAYMLSTWEQPHRAVMMAASGVGVALVLATELLPIERVVASRWREPFFIAWSSVLIALIAVVTAADGGADSPVRLVFVLPLIFAALSYPPSSVLVVGLVDILAYGFVVMVEPGRTEESVFVGFILLGATLMCWWEARDRQIQAEHLGAITGALEESESTSRARALQQREVAEFGQRALVGTPVNRLMHDAATTLQRVLEVDIAGIAELQEGGSSLLIKAGVGFRDGVVGKATLPAGHRSQSGCTLATDGPVVVEDHLSETRFDASELARTTGVVSGVTVPINVGGAPFGILGVQSLSSRRFGRDEVNFLQSIANALASAIERRNEEEEAHHRALHDHLTGLPNRTLFEDRLGRALAEQERRGSSVAVIFLDIDYFKLVNDSLGHPAGDELLRAVAPRLKQALRPGDTVARFGGDEFGVLLEDISNERDATRVAERIAIALSPPFVVQEREHFVTASAGIAIGGAGQRPEALIRDADAAMYRAKERGRARYEIFDEVMRLRVAKRLRIENELRSAIDREELRVHYQPVVSLASGRIAGAEALVRWEHPQHGLLAPMEFVPIAEESGLITRVGRWVLEEACRQTVSWHRANPDRGPVEISVNMSARQLGDRELTPVVERVLDATGLDPMCLSLELTEGVLIEETEVMIGALCDLRELGVRLVLDDFGTGFSSLASLRRLPFDAIKLDRTFVERLGAERVDNAILSAVVTLAQTLELNVIAEGIETEEQLAIVRSLGCHHVQGFYYSRPVTAPEFGRMLEADRPLVGKPA
ncbi:MAG: putative bifunctional diguanylate cyclase/phosphodiesterase [Solirubrobacterales bacterium]